MNSRVLGAGVIAMVVVVAVLAVILWPGDDVEGAFEPVASLEYEHSPNHIHGIEFDHVNDRLFLASHFGLFSLEDDQLYQVGEERSDLMGLAMNRRQPAEVFVSGHPQGGGNLGLMRSTDSGLTFERTFSGIADETVDFHMMTISPVDPNRMYGWFMGQIYQSTDQGESFDVVQADGLPENGLCWGAPCLAAGSGDADTLFAGTQDGLMVSTDGAGTWEFRNQELGQVAAVTAHPDEPDHLLAYTESMGLASSKDGGVSWESRHGDLPISDGGYVFAIAQDPDDPAHIFVATMDNHVFETIDGGDSWHQVA